MAVYDQIPSYRRIIELEGVSGAADLAVIGDEGTIAKAVRRYVDAGATEIGFTQTDLGSEADQRRTWTVLGELATTLSPAGPQ